MWKGLDGTYLLTLILLLLVLRKTAGSSFMSEKKFVFTVALIEGTESQKACYATARRSVSSHTLVAGGDAACYTCTSDTACVSTVADIPLHRGF
jgi:hypothetical protein